MSETPAKWIACGLDTRDYIGGIHTLMTTTDPSGQSGWTAYNPGAKNQSKPSEIGIWQVSNDVTYANGRWMVAGKGIHEHSEIDKEGWQTVVRYYFPLMTSSDGYNWTFSNDLITDNQMYSHSEGLKVVYNGTIWMLCGYFKTATLQSPKRVYIATSTDGLNWTRKWMSDFNDKYEISDICWSQANGGCGLWVAVGKANQLISPGVNEGVGYVYTSSDNGTTWVKKPFPLAPTIIPTNVIFFRDKVVVAKTDNSGLVYLSNSNYDLSSWTEVQTTLTAFKTFTTRKVDETTTLLIVGGIKTGGPMPVSYTTDGVNWSTGTSSATPNIGTIYSFSPVFSANGSTTNILAGGPHGKLSLSVNGMTDWNVITVSDWQRIGHVKGLDYKY